jgi:hypothetical protein
MVVMVEDDEEDINPVAAAAAAGEVTLTCCWEKMEVQLEGKFLSKIRTDSK